MDFAEPLKRAMAEADLSSTQVGAAIGVSSDTVKKWRQGVKAPGGRNLIALVRLLPGFGRAIGLVVA